MDDAGQLIDADTYYDPSAIPGRVDDSAGNTEARWKRQVEDKDLEFRAETFDARGNCTKMICLRRSNTRELEPAEVVYFDYEYR